MGGSRAVQGCCVPHAVEEERICSHLPDELVAAHNGFVVSGARENSCSILDPAGGSAMEIYDDGGVTFLANILPPDLVGGALPRKMHAVHTRNEAREAHLPKQFLLVLDGGDVVKAHARNTTNPSAPVFLAVLDRVEVAEPIPKFAVKGV